MAKATPRDNLVAAVKQAADIVDEALPAVTTPSAGDRTVMRGAAMGQILREVLDTEIDG
jgi:hypothetical protein